jgi:hypothetical protein
MWKWRNAFNLFKMFEKSLIIKKIMTENYIMVKKKGKPILSDVM